MNNSLIGFALVATVVATVGTHSVHAGTNPPFDPFSPVAFRGPFDTLEAACSGAVTAQGGDIGDGDLNAVKVTNGVCEKFTGAKIAKNKSAKKTFSDVAFFDFGKDWDFAMAVKTDGKWYVSSFNTLARWRGKSCGNWRYNIDEVADAPGLSTPAIQLKFSQTLTCDVPAPRDAASHLSGLALRKSRRQQTRLL
jgi:hypothetical protein